MSETPLTPHAIDGPFPANPQSITTQLLIAFEAGDPGNGNSFPYTGKDVLLAFNKGVVPRTFTIVGQADSQLRKGNIGAITVAAGDVHAFDFTGGGVGWRDTNGNVLLQCSHLDMNFAVLTHK